MTNGVLAVALFLAVLGVVFGGIPWLLDRFEHPGRNLLIALAVWAGLGLWILYRWQRF